PQLRALGGEASGMRGQTMDDRNIVVRIAGNRFAEAGVREVALRVTTGEAVARQGYDRYSHPQRFERRQPAGIGKGIEGDVDGAVAREQCRARQAPLEMESLAGYADLGEPCADPRLHLRH